MYNIVLFISYFSILVLILLISYFVPFPLIKVFIIFKLAFQLQFIICLVFHSSFYFLKFLIFSLTFLLKFFSFNFILQSKFLLFIFFQLTLILLIFFLSFKLFFNLIKPSNWNFFISQINVFSYLYFFRLFNLLGIQLHTI
jgi:hypothetical protein